MILYKCEFVKISATGPVTHLKQPVTLNSLSDGNHTAIKVAVRISPSNQS